MLLPVLPALAVGTAEIAEVKDTAVRLCGVEVAASPVEDDVADAVGLPPTAVRAEE